MGDMYHIENLENLHNQEYCLNQNQLELRRVQYQAKATEGSETVNPRQAGEYQTHHNSEENVDQSEYEKLEEDHNQNENLKDVHGNEYDLTKKILLGEKGDRTDHMAKDA